MLAGFAQRVEGYAPTGPEGGEKKMGLNMEQEEFHSDLEYLMENVS